MSNIQDALSLIIDGALYERRRDAMTTNDDKVKEVLFEILCECHNRATKEQILEVMERVHD